MSLSSINLFNFNQYIQNIRTGRQLSQSRNTEASANNSGTSTAGKADREKVSLQSKPFYLEVEQKSSFNFQFDYEQNNIQLQSANGFYELKQEKLQFSMGVEFYMRSNINGQVVEQKYKLDLSFSIENTQQTQGSIKIQKEDIGLYVLRILKTLSDYAKEKDINIASLLLDDMEEIAAIKDGKLLEKIFALVSAMYWTKKMANSEAEDSILYVPRKKQNILEISQQDFSEIKLSISGLENITLSDSHSEEPTNDSQGVTKKTED